MYPLKVSFVCYTDFPFSNVKLFTDPYQYIFIVLLVISDIENKYCLVVS